MNAEQFCDRLRGILYTMPGCDDPLTPYGLYQILTQLVQELDEERYHA